MFEGSLMESRGLIASRTQKWTALGSLALQCTVAAVLIAIPMLRPEMLPVSVMAPKITVPEIRQTTVIQRVADAAAHAAAAMTVPPTVPMVEQRWPLVFLHGTPVDEGAPPVGPTTLGMGDHGAIATIATIGTGSGGPTVVPRARNMQPMRVSSGVVSGLLLSPITPVYPPIARAAHVEGSVVIEAVISRAGRVESLNVVSGPEMLRRAALEAVERARYAPYKLNGDPVDVQTVITVVFRLGNG
jgi:protein TonB